MVFRYVPFGERVKFVGTWQYERETEDGYSYPEWAVTFNSDGTCSLKGWPGTWEVENGKLVVILDHQPTVTSRWDYSFSEDGKTLDLTGFGGELKKLD